MAFSASMRCWVGTVLVAVLGLGTASADAQEADVWLSADVAAEGPSSPDEPPPPPVVTLRSGPTTGTLAPGDERTSLGIRATGRPDGLRLHLRPIDAAWGEAFECGVPCTALVGPGRWAVELSPRPGIAPHPVDGSPLELTVSGRLRVDYRSNAAARTAGFVVLVIGALALIGALVGVGVVYGQRDDGSLASSINRALGAFLVIPGVAGIALGVTGIVLTSMGPVARARWTPDP